MEGMADMKRKTPRTILSLLLIALLFITRALPAGATEAQIPEYGLFLSLPASLDVITRNTPPDDPVLRLYGLSTDQLRREGLYLKAYDVTGEYTLALSLSQSGGDYNLLGEAELLGIASSQNGAKAEVFYTSQAVFLLYANTEGTRLTCQTQAGGIGFTLTLSAPSGLKPGMSGTLKAIAQSADFGLGQ